MQILHVYFNEESLGFQLIWLFPCPEYNVNDVVDYVGINYETEYKKWNFIDLLVRIMGLNISIADSRNSAYTVIYDIKVLVT